jgi:hypothetical protein
MKSSRSLSTAAASFTVIASIIFSTGTAHAATSNDSSHQRQPRVEVTRIGHPIWKPADFHVFSAPIGTAASGYAEFTATTLAILPGPDHQAHPQLGVGPGMPHRGPYRRELRQGIADLDLHENGPFTLPEFSSGNGVWLAFMVVPSPGTRGSSPDFRRGRIIPNELFPIGVVGTLSLRGEPFDPNLANFAVPPLDDPALDPPFAVDGHSHFPVFVASNTDFGVTNADSFGPYTFRLTVLDQQGSGWRITARFVVQD